MFRLFVMPKTRTPRRARLLSLAALTGTIVAVSTLTPLASSATDAPPPPVVELGTAGSYSALASAALTSAGGSAAGAMNTSGGDSAMQAQLDLTAAYNSVAALAPTASLEGDLGGRTITPGVYHSVAALAMTTSVTFDALGDPNAVFIFQVGAAINTTAGSTMILLNGAQASRIYWQTVAAVTTGASSYFTGTILGNAAITAGAGTVLQGRALTMGGAVTLDGVSLLPVPDISMTAGVSPTVDVEAGDPVVFTNIIRNRGNVDLALTLATGLPNSAVTTFAWPDAARVLPAGQSITATTTYAPSLADAAARQVTSAATVTGTPVGFGAVFATSSVTLVVHPTPVLDSMSTPKGTPVTFNVLANDAGAEVGGIVSRATLGTKRRLVGGATGPAPSTPANGSVTCVDTGVDRGLCTYQPAGLFTGTDFFDYTLSQDTRSWNVRVSVTVTPTVSAPTTREDRVVATVGGPAVTFDPTANDTDANTGTLSIVSHTGLPMGYGAISCGDASCTFMPPATGLGGTAQASYTAADVSPAGAAGPSSGPTSITVFVDPAPAATTGFSATDTTSAAVASGSWTGTTVTSVEPSLCTAGRVSTAISWRPIPGASSYALQRRLTGTTPGPWIPLAELAAGATKYIDGQLGEGNTYQWQVRPDNHRWHGEFSPPSAASTEPAAANAAGC